MDGLNKLFKGICLSKKIQTHNFLLYKDEGKENRRLFITWIIHEPRLLQMRGVDVWSCTHVLQMRRNKADEVLSTRFLEVKNVDYG